MMNWTLSKRAQLLIGSIPLLLVWVYLSIYIYGVCSQYAYVGYNDKQMIESYKQNNVVKVDTMEQSADGSYNVHLTYGDDIEEFDVKAGDTIYELQRLEDNWYRYWVNDTYIYTSVPALVDSSSYEDNKIVVNNREFKIDELNEFIVYTVTLNSDGEYTITYSDGTTQDVDSLPNVNTILASDNGYRIQVTAGSQKDIAISSIVAVFSLPTDDVYMDLCGNVLVRNLSKDYWKLTLASSKYQFILIAFSCLVIFICFNYFNKRFDELANKRFLIVYIVTEIAMLLGVAFTYIMLSNSI